MAQARDSGDVLLNNLSKNIGRACRVRNERALKNATSIFSH